MDFYLGLLQIIGVHTLLGLSAYVVLLTGQVSLAQAGFMAVGAYVAAMLTVLAQWALVPALLAGGSVAAVVACLVGFPRAPGARADAGGGDAGVRRGGAPVLLQLRLSDRHGRHQGRPARRRGLPPDPLLPGERLDHVPGDGVHLADRGRGDGGAVVDGPLARRCRAARRGRGRDRRPELRHQPHRREGARP